MQVINPTTITQGMITSSNAVESNTEWAAATAYAINATVMRASIGRVYQRLIAGTTATAPEFDTVNWLDTGPTNKWAMFDSLVSTQTTTTGTLNAVIAPGYVTSIGLFNLAGSAVTVEVKDTFAGTVIATGTQAMDAAIITDWYMYFYTASSSVDSFVFNWTPGYAACSIKITMTGSAPKIGYVTVGLLADIGFTQYGVTLGIIDYSIKSTDTFGVTTFTKRAFSKRMTAQVMAYNTNLSVLTSLLYGLRATPCAWIGGSGATGYGALSFFGFYKDFSIDVAYPSASLCNLEIESLT